MIKRAVLYVMENITGLINKLASIIDSGRPPARIPERLMGAFTADGRIPIIYSYNDGRTRGHTSYSNESITRAIAMIKDRHAGIYGKVGHWLYEALEKYPIKGARVLVIGSTEQGFGPWYECVSLCFGASPVTIEYADILYEDPRLKAMTPAAAQEARLNFDAAIAISSYEHDGLGRYGERLDPDADIKAMGYLKKMVNPGGLLYLAVPLGKDKVVFNAHRIYGRFRLPRLLAGWKMIDSMGYDESLLDRDTGSGWMPKDKAGRMMHPGYPEYSPILILQNA